MTSKNHLKYHIFIIAIIYSNISNAALISRLNGQAMHDLNLNIAWLTNANLAASNTFNVSGVNTGDTMKLRFRKSMGICNEYRCRVRVSGI